MNITNFIKKTATAALITAMMLSIAACGDPHRGQVEIFDGSGSVWISPAPGVEASSFKQGDFTYTEDGEPVYVGDEFTTRRGIDVSFYQQEIDWEAVAADGIEFAMIRCGYRGYTAGALNEDERFRENVEGALAAGLEVGVYFFSQAISAQEGREEAEYVLELIKGYDITLPIAYDWERIDNEPEARTNELDAETLTQCAVAFCQTIEAAGYEPCMYFYRHTGYYGFDLTKLSDYMFWLGTPGDFPDFYYAHAIWQYSFEGGVDGIAGNTDMNLLFEPVEKD